VIQNNQNNFAEEIEDLYRLHYITKKYDHIIKYQRGAWKLFEPTKFIYAFFAFNSFYNFDWEESLKIRKLTAFPKIIKDGVENEPSESQKYKAMIDFIFARVENSDKELFLKIIKGKGEIEKTIDAISRITPDNRISESERENFKKEFGKLLETNDIKIGKLKNDIIRFVYLVRNNIFHGTKNTIEMSEAFQRKRLDIYSNIIIAVNELLFKVLERKTDFSPHERYSLSSHF
jgi:hypothetical protein